MLRLTLAPALLLALPCFAGDDAPRRTEPAASFAAEAVVQAAKVQAPDVDGMTWVELSLRVTRCHAGPCMNGQLVKVLTSADVWRGRHGEKLGVVRYVWNDARKMSRSWSLALRLEDADERERFERESEAAVASVGEPKSEPVATR